MLRVLIVDDEDSVLAALALALQSLGHAATQARNGREAIEKCCSQHFDVVITDVLMPEHEGLSTIRTLAHDHPDVRIIAISGGGRVSPTDYLNMAKSFGANTVLAKPFSRDELEAAINAAMREVST